VVLNGPKQGVPLSDVWDIPYLNPKARERTGYPTQKPILLLERIINLVTDTDDTVLDPFCGSGTTLVAAEILGRHSIGMDISEDAIAITKERLKNPIKSESGVLKFGRNSYENDNRELDRLLRGVEYTRVHRNKGIDAFLKTDAIGKPVPIRIQKKGESINEAASQLYKAASGKNIDVMFLISIESNALFDIASEIPPEVIILDSIPKAISKKINEIARKLEYYADKQPESQTITD